MLNKFSDEDVSRMQKLMARIVKEGRFELSMNQFVELFNELDWVNKTIIPKIRDNVMEFKSIKQVEEPAEPVKKKATRKRTAK